MISLEKIERRRRQLQLIAYVIIMILAVALISLLFFVDNLTNMFANLKYNIFLRFYLLVFIVASILYLGQKERQQDMQTKLLMDELRETSNRLAGELREDIFLNKISHKLANLSNDEALDYLFTATKEFLDADGGVLSLKTERGDWEQTRKASDENIGDEDELARAVAKWIEQTGRSFLFPNPNISAAKLGLEDKNVDTVLAVALRLKGKLFGVITFWRSKIKDVFNEHELNFLQIVARQAAGTAFNRQLAQAKDDQFNELLLLLAKAIDERESDSNGHSDRAAQCARKISEQMGLSNDEIETIERAAILQNIGYLALPKELFSQYSLTDEENALLEDHPRYGAKMLRSLKLPRRITDLVLLHHEWADGSRPQAMPKKDVPLGAKIIAVADAFVSISKKGEDGRLIFVHEAVNEIRELGRERFDPDVVEALVKTLETDQSQIA